MEVDFAAPADYVEPVRPSAQGAVLSGARAAVGASAGQSSAPVIIDGDDAMSGSSGKPAIAAPETAASPALKPSKYVPFGGSGFSLSGSGSPSVVSGAASRASPMLSSSPAPTLLSSSGGVVLSGGKAAEKPRSLNRFEEARRAKAFAGAGHTLKD
jgi:hypothetical protein